MGADVSGKSFRLDLVETSEQSVVTDMTLHGKAESGILAPLRPDMLRTLYFSHAGSARHLRRLDNGYWGRAR
jgi:hypothetical protein